MRVDNDWISQVLGTHWLDSEILEEDQFARCFVERGEAMLELIGRAMDKTITGGQETFWAALSSAGVAEALQTTYPVNFEDSVDTPDDENEFDALGEDAYSEEPLAADDD